MLGLKKQKGKLGEGIAVKFLQKKSYKILQINFLARYGEIDIVALDKDTLVFIEVKTRSSNQFGTPIEAITYWKLQAIIKTAQFYKLTHKNLPDLMRIDAVSVLLDVNGNTQNIEHMENISGF